MKTRALAYSLLNTLWKDLQNGKPVAFVGDMTKSERPIPIVRSMISTTSLASIMVPGLNKKVLKKIKEIAAVHGLVVWDENLGYIVVWANHVDKY